MAETNKRYFWLKLKDDFFGQKEIKMLRRIAGGDTYTIIYLKMLLLSLKNDGKIYFDGIAENFVEEIALDIDEDTENTQITFNYLAQKGLIEFSDAELEMTNIASMIGSETDAARRKRKQRNREKTLLGDNVTTKSQLGHTEIEIEKELETDIEKDKEQEPEKKEEPYSSRHFKSDMDEIVSFYENNGFGTISPNGFAAIDKFLEEHNKEMIILAMKTADLQNRRNIGYAAGILRNWKNSGFTKPEQVEAADTARQKNQMYNNNRYQNNSAGETRPKWLDEDKEKKRANVQELKSVTEDKELSDLISKFREN